MSTRSDGDETKSRMSLKIEGMHCASCVATVEKSLLKQEGVISATVSLLDEKAVVEYESGRVNRATLEQAVNSTGYRARRPTAALTLTPRPQQHEWEQISDKVKRVEGIISVRSYPETGRLMVEYDDDLVTPKIVKRNLKALGYESTETSASRADRETLAREKEIRSYATLLAFSAILTVPVMLIMFGLLAPVLPASLTPDLAMFILTTPVQFIAGYPFYKSSLRVMRHGKTNMDTLIMLGTSAAYFYSVAATFVLSGYTTFYDTAASLITFILLGRTLEAVAKGRTSRAVRSLIDLQAQIAIVERNGQEMTIPAEDVEVGDVVVVRPGDKVPVDGVVIGGESTVDESMVTGESMPVAKTSGDTAIGATINKGGVLRIKASKVGRDTVLSQIVKLVEDAQTQKPPIQRRADAIAEVFVPVVLIIATSTFIFWAFFMYSTWVRALSFTIAVLVAACPCALGLATPTAIMVGIGRGAKQGILFKTGSGLEMIPKVDTIVFDKTGTLTVGRPTVTDIICASDTESVRALQLVASLEKNSEHPLAEAIVRYAQEENIEFLDSEDFSSESGKGVRGIVDGLEILVGNDRYMIENSVDISDIESHSDMLEAKGKTVVYAARDGRPLALMAVADVAKETSAKAIKILKGMNLDVWMMSGDKEKTARAIANGLGIENVLAEVLPADKAMQVKRIQMQGHAVAMVGDGVNDAPALAQADVGIALGSGTAVSIETGDIVLVKDDLLDVVSGIELGRKTMAKIKQGFFWALVYNMALLPVAAGLLFPFTGLVLKPEYAGLAMSLSSVSVVTNALLLGRSRPRVAHMEAATPLLSKTPMQNTAIDPVCKMDVDMDTAELHSDSMGKRYFFCSPYCKKTFDSNPEAYRDKDTRT